MKRNIFVTVGAIGLLLSLAAPAAAQERSIEVGPYAAVLAGSAVDLGATLYALRDSRLSEGNLMLKHGGTPGLVAMKAGATAGSMLTMRWLAQRGHPKVARIFGYSIGAIATGLAVNNTRLARNFAR